MIAGTALHAERVGVGPPVLLLHGFTGSAATWTRTATGLAARYSALAVDLPGHGRSAGVDDGCYGMAGCVAALLALLDRSGVDRAAVVGYSMGGRVALHLALAAPDRVRALVLESTSPGIADPAERAARAQSDLALAARIEREGVQPFVDWWEQLPLFASQRTLGSDARARLRAQRLRSDAPGLAASLRGMGAGAMEPVVDRLHTIAAPTLLVAGEHDAKYRALGETIAWAMPSARLAVVPNAGHTVHLEAPQQFDTMLLSFLDDVHAVPASTPPHAAARPGAR